MNIESTDLQKSTNPPLHIADVSKRFSVHTYSIINEGSPMYAHWSEGLKMIIVKDGVTLKLNSEEIKQLVKALPRTIGGSY